MTTTLDHPSADDVVRRLTAATRKAEELTRRRATLEARLEEARRTYRRLADSAREKFGTDDLAALQEKLRAMEDENARLIIEFEASLRRVENQIAQSEAILRSEAA